MSARRIVLFFVLLSGVVAAPPPGLPNFHEVDQHVYRGAQPTPEGFRNLAHLGIRTVIDLRGAEHSQAEEKKIVEAAGMSYVSDPMKGLSTPTDKQIAAALQLLNDGSSGPVFVHCRRGADRTGAVVACYRIEHDHWDTARALNEAVSYGMSWFQIGIRRYIERFAAVSPAAMMQSAP